MYSARTIDSEWQAMEVIGIVAPVCPRCVFSRPRQAAGRRRGAVTRLSPIHVRKAGPDDVRCGSAFVYLLAWVRRSADQGITTIFLPGEDACASHACVALCSG